MTEQKYKRYYATYTKQRNGVLNSRLLSMGDIEFLNLLDQLEWYYG